MSPIKFPTKSIFPNFHILKIKRMTSFCNLFVERSSYNTANNKKFFGFNSQHSMWPFLHFKIAFGHWNLLNMIFDYL